MENKGQIEVFTINDAGNEKRETGESKTMYVSNDPIIEINYEKKDANINDSNHQRQVTHPTSYMDTMLHIFRGNVGSGLLAMGDAYKNGGLVFAPIMTVFLGVISVHAQHILLNCSHKMHQKTKCDKPPDFARTVELCFATGPQRLRKLSRTMNLLVNAFLCITQLGFCCIYIVFIATNVHKICSQYKFDLELSVHMALVLIPILLACMVRNLKYLTPFSSTANVFMVMGISIVIYYACQDLPPVNTRAYIGTWRQLPLFFGTTIYAFEGIGLVLPLKSEMKNPETFQKPFGVLNLGMGIVGAIFMVVGFLGYCQWGDAVEGSLTLNLPEGQILSNVVQLLIALGILFTYPLQFYVPVAITWPALVKKLPEKWSPVYSELVYRACLVFLTFVLAESIPHLSLFISLVGAVSSTALAIIFPPIIEIVSGSQERDGNSWWTIMKNTIIVLMGLFIFTTGTIESITAIIKAFNA